MTRFWLILITIMLFGCNNESNKTAPNKTINVKPMALNTHIPVYDEHFKKTEINKTESEMLCILQSYCPSTDFFIKAIKKDVNQIAKAPYSIVFVFQNEWPYATKEAKAAFPDKHEDEINAVIAVARKEGGNKFIVNKKILRKLPGKHYYLDPKLGFKYAVSSAPAAFNYDTKAFDIDPFLWLVDHNVITVSEANAILEKQPRNQ